jgi:ADP-heptose:LPS heptosyltransferase
MKKILCIRPGAFGDLFQALPFFISIKKHYKNAHISILIRKPFEKIARDFNIFDDVIIEHQYSIVKNPIKFIKFANSLSNFDEIFDFQMVDRTGMYKLFNKSNWHGSKKIKKKHIHGFDRYNALLNESGIKYSFCKDDFCTDNDKFNIKKPYALLVPGASNAHNGAKIWDENNFKIIAEFLLSKGVEPVIIGGPFENYSKIPGTSLCGETNAMDLISLGKNAIVSIGNDTGPMHAFSLWDNEVIILYSGFTDPEKHAPKTKKLKYFRSENINEIKGLEVVKELEELLFIKKDICD